MPTLPPGPTAPGPTDPQWYRQLKEWMKAVNKNLLELTVKGGRGIAVKQGPGGTIINLLPFRKKEISFRMTLSGGEIDIFSKSASSDTEVPDLDISGGDVYLPNNKKTTVSGTSVSMPTSGDLYVFLRVDYDWATFGSAPTCSIQNSTSAPTPMALNASNTIRIEIPLAFIEEIHTSPDYVFRLHRKHPGGDIWINDKYLTADDVWLQWFDDSLARKVIHIGPDSTVYLACSVLLDPTDPGGSDLAAAHARIDELYDKLAQLRHDATGHAIDIQASGTSTESSEGDGSPGNPAYDINPDDAAVSSYLLGWWDFDALGLSDGTAITTLTDQSANGNDLSQSTASYKATYKTAIQNGLDIGRFDGTNDFVDASTFISAGTNWLTAFIVAKADSWTNYGNFLNELGSTNSIGDFLLRIGTNGVVNIFARSAATTAVRWWTGPTISSGSWFILVVRWKGDSSASAYFWLNGSKTSDTSSAPETYNEPVYATRTRIGAEMNLYRPFDGDMGEVILYKHANETDISDTIMDRLISGLNTKWGVF